MIYTLGIDIGSTTSKAILLGDGEKLVAHKLIVAATGTRSAKGIMDAVLEEAGMKRADISYVMATGYGRLSLEGADGEMSELSCHGKGISKLYPSVRTIVDIGGQDAKVIRLDNQGRMENFAMNDKCAAGTGRFLDVMAGILEMPVSELENAAEASENHVKISSTCTVFAESEVISQLANGAAIPDVVAGICDSVAVRVASLAKRVGVVPEVFLSGGVSRNGAVRKALERELNVTIMTSDLAQLMGAYGAALFAYKKACS